ncbi:MAG: SDR family oxidoreductase [Bifidobacteriaceae bacterium]|jgi:2,5-dichloro-2,5-cyclohexadiene-1,4-diol dehydrogenase 1|nr:SDR family oxidoreductase [Bifidobacteriaceae bacterium]
MTIISGIEGKSVIVTGGATGIGRAAVEILLRNGASVTVGSRRQAVGHELLRDLEQHADRLQFVTTDVSAEADDQRLVSAALERFGSLDGAVNSAGMPPRGVPIHQMSAEQWAYSVSVNLTGLFFCVKYQMQAMMEAGRSGSIVVISSTAAVCTVPGSAEYVATKAGANGLVRAAALDAAAHQIRVNGIMPGAIQTPMFDAARGDNADFEPVIAAIPVGRVGTPVEVGAAAAWLVSDQSTYVTGVTFAVDGGGSLD